MGFLGRTMLVVACLLVVGHAAYLKAWEDPDGPQRSVVPSFDDQQLLSRLQNYLDRADELEPPSSKRQMRYNQCYFNPISCFRRRK